MTAQDLKNSILQLAIQGKLVEQKAEEGTAEELYKQIQAEKQKLIKEGKIKKEKPLPEITDDEITFEIPQSWKWVMVGNISTVLGGKRIPAGRKLCSDNTGYIYIRVSDMRDGYIETNNLKYIPKDIYPSISRYIINKEDIFITVAGTIGKVGKIPKDLDGSNLTENADRLVFSQINQDWFIKALQSSLVQNQIVNLTTKVGQPKLAIARIQKLFIPLPPLEEQKRIVAKIEELMPLVEKYGKAYEKIEELNKKFPVDMQKSILQYAVEGKLVEQRAEEGTAEELYKQIQAEKQKLIKEGKIKKEKPLPEITEDEIPFEIPQSWKWVRLNDLCEPCDVPFADGPFGSNLKSIHYTDKPEVRIIQLSNIGKLGWKNENIKYTTFKHLDTISRSKVNAGDIVIAKMMPAGRAIEIPIQESAYVLSSDAVKFVPNHMLSKKYLLFAINSSIFRRQIYSQVQGITRVRTSLTKIRSYLLPIPPLAEQKRIVAKIEELMPFCNQLIK